MHKGGANVEAFRVAVRQSDEACRVTLAGELDTATAPMLRDALMTVHGHVTIDCEQLSFADSSGIAELLTLARRVESIGIEKPSKQLRRSLEILDLAVVLGLDEQAT
jgi:anti-anti-sigma factor